jgi:hypothetical protein
VEEVDTRFREARRNGVEVPRRRDADPLDFETIPGAGEGDWPFVQQDMLQWLPAEVLFEFGEAVSTSLNGEMLYIASDRIDDFIRAMNRAGYQCIRDDDAVSRACGM